MNHPSVRIADHSIGPDNPSFIIAEVGVNHNGDLDLAIKLIEEAALAGVDAVKFQTFNPAALVTPDAPKAAYQSKNAPHDESQYEMLQRVELPQDFYPELLFNCLQHNIIFLSTPFDEQSVDFLEELGVPAYKVASGEITNFPLLHHIARKAKPVIMSTGMATMTEVDEAVGIFDEQEIALVLLHCVSNYPAESKDVNLKAMETMREKFRVPVGYSDHTLGIEISIASVALGASVIEKHFTLDRSMTGPDHQASLEPEELNRMVQGIRNVEAALGDGRKRPAKSEAEIAAVSRRSIVAAHDIPENTKLTGDMLVLRRPGTGLPPKMLLDIVGRQTSIAFRAGDLIHLEGLK